MKTIQKHIFIIIVSLVALLLVYHETFAQSVESIEIQSRSLQTEDCSISALSGLDRPAIASIFEEDYPYLTHVNCLKNGYFSGWEVKLRNINPETPTHFTLQGVGLGINVYATYDNEGHLVEGELRKKNVPLPVPIRNNLFQNYNGWKITGNEKVVIDFDRRKTVYKVDLQNGNDEQTIHIDKNGNRVVFFANL